MLDLLRFEIKPLLAASDSPSSNPDYFKKLPFPMFGSPKCDGIRGLVLDDVMTRELMKVPSLQVQMQFRSLEFFDGELHVGKPNREEQINLCQTHIMSANKPADIGYSVFDICDPSIRNKPYYQRLEILEKEVERAAKPNLNVLEHVLLENLDDLLELEQKYLDNDWEGMMLRNPYGVYKWGRSTFDEAILLKLKRFEDDEALIIDIIEGNTNKNVLTTDNLGYAKRSKAKAGLQKSGIAGKFVVDWKGKPTVIGPGKFTKAELAEIWERRDEYINKEFLKFQYFKYGSKNTERFNKALCFRSKLEIPEDKLRGINEISMEELLKGIKE